MSQCGREGKEGAWHNNALWWETTCSASPALILSEGGVLMTQLSCTWSHLSKPPPTQHHHTGDQASSRWPLGMHSTHIQTITFCPRLQVYVLLMLQNHFIPNSRKLLPPCRRTSENQGKPLPAMSLLNWKQATCFQDRMTQAQGKPSYSKEKNRPSARMKSSRTDIKS